MESPLTDLEIIGLVLMRINCHKHKFLFIL